MGIVLGKYNGYVDTLRERLVTKRVAESISSKATSLAELLEQKARQETADATKPPKQWKETALNETMAFFQNKAELDKYTKSAMAALKADGGAKFNVQNTNDSVEKKYAELLKQAEQNWFAEQRKAGTLPWVFATDAEKKKASMSEADKKALYDKTIQELSSKYHAFA